MNNTVRNSSVLSGLVLIALGGIFMLQNMVGYSFGNWWALFILIPAVTSLAQAYRFYQQDGDRLSSRVVGTFSTGIVLATVASVFLFDLDWDRVWPLFMILAGLGIMTRTNLKAQG